MNQSLQSEFETLLSEMGKTGRHLAEMGASEGAAGNISVCLRQKIELREHFPLTEEIELPQIVPELAGAIFIVSGSGQRLREIIEAPTATLGCISVNEGGKTGTLHTSPNRRFKRVTSEFNSHLAVHHSQMANSENTFHAIIHAQPLHLTYLSHISRYVEESYLNHRLLRWQPETILNFPEGFGVVPFCVPGSSELMSLSVKALQSHQLVIWAKHGVMARSSASFEHAEDLIEYAETAAKYEYLNLASGEPADGLLAEEIREICEKFKINQNIF